MRDPMRANVGFAANMFNRGKSCRYCKLFVANCTNVSTKQHNWKISEVSNGLKADKWGLKYVDKVCRLIFWGPTSKQRKRTLIASPPSLCHNAWCKRDEIVLPDYPWPVILATGWQRWKTRSAPECTRSIFCGLLETEQTLWRGLL